MLSRRTILAQGSACLAALAYGQAGSPLLGARLDPATVDAARIREQAIDAMAKPVRPLSSLPQPPTSVQAHTFYSRPEGPGEFLAHRLALRDLQNTVTALVAASLLTPAQLNPGTAKTVAEASAFEQPGTYAARAAEHLRAWFLDEQTAMRPDFDHATAAMITDRDAIQTQGVLDAVPLAEIARAALFLKPALTASSETSSVDTHGPHVPQNASTPNTAKSQLSTTTGTPLTEDEFTQLQRWFGQLAGWCTSSVAAGLARDRRDHTASSWLLLTATSAHLATNDAILAECRRRYRTVTLRSQVSAEGFFPNELVTDDAFRNSLWNLDLLGAAVEALSTTFETLWPYELQDGPSMQAAFARHVPYIENRNAWPYPADHTLFRQVPLRRPTLLLAARAYDRPEYAQLWKSLPPPAANLPPELEATLPVKQELLWTRRPPVPPRLRATSM